MAGAEDAHFVAEILDDLGCCGRNEVITCLLGTFGFYFELLDIVSDWVFLALLQVFVDSETDGADIVENYSIGFYCSLTFPWLLILISSILRLYGHTAISYETTSVNGTKKGKDGVNSGKGGIAFFYIFSDNFVIRTREALTCSRYDPRKHAYFPVNEMESMRSLSIAILEDVPQFALKLGLFFALDESKRKLLGIDGGAFAYTLSFVTTVLSLFRAVVTEWHKKKDYPTLSFFQYLGHVFAFIHPNDQYVTAIADHIVQKSYSATCLHLAGGSITDEGMETLANALSKSGHLSMESKEKAKAEEEEAEETKERCRWIQRPPLTLRRINLGWNNFNAGVIALSNALESYEGIQILDLRGCKGIGRDGYEKLGELLVNHSTLNTLILSESGSDFVGGVSYGWAAQITDGHKEKIISFEDVHDGNCMMNALFNTFNKLNI